VARRSGVRDAQLPARLPSRRPPLAEIARVNQKERRSTFNAKFEHTFYAIWMKCSIE
jgi:hypothetical protein